MHNINERNNVLDISKHWLDYFFRFWNKFKYIEKGTLLQFIDYQEFERVEFLLNCPHCDEEIVYEDATFCPKCGKSLASEEDIEQNTVDTQQKRTELGLAAAILTIVSATFIASTGYLGTYQYQSLLDYYGSSMASEFLGFLIFGILGIISAAFALVGSMFILQRKRFKISMLGAIFPLVSVIGTYITIQQYAYGFTDTLLFALPNVLILTIMSILLLVKSKAEFT